MLYHRWSQCWNCSHKPICWYHRACFGSESVPEIYHCSNRGNSQRERKLTTRHRSLVTLEASLTSMSSSIREQAVTTLKYIAPLWPGPMADDLVRHLIELCCKLGTSMDSSEAWCRAAAIHASALQGIARVLKYIDKSCLGAPDTPLQALDMSLKLLVASNSSVSSFIPAIVMGLTLPVRS